MSIIALAAAAAFVGQSPLITTAGCPTDKPAVAGLSGARPGAKRLADLPNAQQMRAVIRTVGPCPVIEVKSEGRWVLKPVGPERGATPAR